MAQRKTSSSSSSPETRNESFVVDLLLERDKVKLTKVLHVASDNSERWDGWDGERLLRFLKSQMPREPHSVSELAVEWRSRAGAGAGAESTPPAPANGQEQDEAAGAGETRASGVAQPSEPAAAKPAGTSPSASGPSTAAAIVTNSPPPAAVAAAAPPTCRIVKAEVRRQDDICLDPAAPKVATNEGFAIELQLAASKSAVGQPFWATASALGFDGGKVALGAVRGSFSTGASTSAVIAVNSGAGLQPGLYSLWVAVASGSAKASTGAGSLELVAPVLAADGAPA